MKVTWDAIPLFALTFLVSAGTPAAQTERPLDDVTMLPAMTVKGGIQHYKLTTDER